MLEQHQNDSSIHIDECWPCFRGQGAADAPPPRQCLQHVTPLHREEEVIAIEALERLGAGGETVCIKKDVILLPDALGRTGLGCTKTRAGHAASDTARLCGAR